MRYFVLMATLTVSLAGQGQPNCTGVGLDVDFRCSCVKDPNSQSCALYKSHKDFYDGKPMQPSPLLKYVESKPTVGPTVGTATPGAQPRPAVRAQKARVVALPSKDFIRFLQPDSFLAIGFDFGKLFGTPEVAEALFGGVDGADARNKLLGALQEVDHLWLSVAPNNDPVMVMTGKFEQGAMAGMLYQQGIMPIFLGDAHAMMIGTEPAMRAALARMAKPAANGGWVAQQARELSKDHETWIVTEPPVIAAKNVAPGAAILQSVRRFSMGMRLTGEAMVEGEAVTDSEASAQKIAAWIEQVKTSIREKTGVGVLDPLKVTLDGTTLRYIAKDEGLLNGDIGKKAMNSDFGVELYGVMMAGFPGATTKTVAEDKILSVKPGMKREEVLQLLGPPLSVSSIQGLDQPRETFLYQVPFGKQYSVRLDGGVVTGPPQSEAR
jgi:hypothetical protein